MKAISSSEQRDWINEKSGEDGTCSYIKHALFFFCSERFNEYYGKWRGGLSILLQL